MRHEFYLTMGAALATQLRVEWTQGKRSHFLCALGIGRNGILRTALNHTAPNAQQVPSGHAERVLLRKAHGVKTVYVVRADGDGQWALAKPCHRCTSALKAAGVKKVVYTMGVKEYGVMLL